MNEVTWAEYVLAVSGSDSGRVVAAKVGQSESAVSRWKNGTVVPFPREAVAFARAYDRVPVEALIAAGYLTEEEAGLTLDPPREIKLRDYTDLELARETLRRVEANPQDHDILTQPLDDEHPAMRDSDEPPAA